MTLFQIVGLYTALNLLILPILIMRVGKARTKSKVSLGDGNDPMLLAHIRAHGNFIETAPFALVGLFALAMLSAAPLVLHVFGAVFTFGRLAHIHGMAQENALGKGRMIGALLSFFTYIGMALALLILIFTG